MRWSTSWLVIPVIGFWMSVPVGMSAQSCPVPTSTAEQQTQAQELYFSNALFYLDRGKWRKALAELDTAGAWWPAVRTPFKRRYSILSKKERLYEPFFQAGVCHQEVGELDEALLDFALAECRQALDAETREDLQVRWNVSRTKETHRGYVLFFDGLDEYDDESWTEAARKFWLAEIINPETGERLPLTLRGGRWKAQKRERYLPRFYLGASLVETPCRDAARKPLETTLLATSSVEGASNEAAQRETFLARLDTGTAEVGKPDEIQCWRWCCWNLKL